jgi:diguanylate cyclase (GGDEF)-like protein/PAS domain S-box-containing protein
MSVWAVSAIVFRLLAFAGCFFLLRRKRDWRLVLVAAMLMVSVAGTTIWNSNQWPSHMELMDGLMTFLALWVVLRIYREHKQVEAQLREKEQHYHSLFDHNQDAVFTIDLNGCVLESNPACTHVTGYRAEELLNKPLSDLIVPEHKEETSRRFRLVLTGQPQEYELSILNKQGQRVDLIVKNLPKHENGKVIGALGIAKDITEQKRSEERMWRMAYYDLLTGLPNKLLFLERLSEELKLAREQGKQVGVLLFDLDRFKLINDTFGHRMGDRLLREVAERLGECLREVDTFSRTGGDEFSLIVPGLSGHEEAKQVAKRIMEELEQPFLVEGHEFYITVSIGISMFPTNGEDADELLKNGDTAMYQAKQQGRNNFQFYSKSMNDWAIQRVALENDLRRALERREFELYYQPQINVATGEVIGLEALVRWNHPTRGRVSPAEFIPLAEESGLIVPLGTWVMEEACRQVREWHLKGYPKVRAAVNLSARQFQREDLVETVARVLQESGLEPQYLDLEITESVTMHNVERVIMTLHELKDLGIHISLDDFGTGYSSLSYLKHFPIHMLKIDQSFVRDITTDPDDAAIANSIIAMAHSLNIGVIAEGVETEDHLAYLLEHGCKEMQGYFFSPPLPADEVEKLLGFVGPHKIVN